MTIDPVAKNIAEGSATDAFNWTRITKPGAYLLTCQIKQFTSSAADILIYKNDEVNPIHESSNHSISVVVRFNQDDIIKIKLRSTKGQYDVYADTRSYFACLIRLK